MRAVCFPLPPPSLLLLLSLSLAPVLCDPTRQLRMKQPADSNLQGFTFRDELLLSIPARSRIHCATVCANTERCVTFTYTRGSSADVTSVSIGGDCKIHSAKMTSSSYMVNTANTNVYQNEDDCFLNPCQNGGSCTDGINNYVCACALGFSGSDCETDNCSPNPCQNGGSCTGGINSYVCACVPGYTGNNCETVNQWLQQACTVNADCPAVNSECFSGKCLCTPGYLYSNSQLTCEASCSSLSVIFLEYPLHDFRGYDEGSLWGKTLQECQDGCVTHATVTCRTLVIVSSGNGGGCYFKAKTALDDPSAWETSGNSVYQRTCN